MNNIRLVQIFRVGVDRWLLTRTPPPSPRSRRLLRMDYRARLTSPLRLPRPNQTRPGQPANLRELNPRLSRETGPRRPPSRRGLPTPLRPTAIPRRRDAHNQVHDNGAALSVRFRSTDVDVHVDVNSPAYYASLPSSQLTGPTPPAATGPAPPREIDRTRIDPPNPAPMAR